MMNDLKIMALWIMLLILTIPLVHAQTLEITRASGKANIEGVVTAPDTLKVSAKARLTEDEQITPDQLRLKMDGFASYLIFSTCTPQGDATQCEFLTDIFQAPTIPMKLTVQLVSDDEKFRDSAVPLKETQTTVVGDTLGAYIESISASPEVSSDGRFSLNFLARDEGTVVGGEGCSGVDKVDIKRKDGKLLVTQQGNKECSFAATTEVTISDPDGEYEICAHPVDRLGKTDIKRLGCVTLIKDTGAPRPVTAQLYQQGEKVEFLRPAADVLVDVFVEISDSSLDRSSVRGDLSPLTNNPSYRNVPPDEFVGEEAIWHDVPTNGMSECLVRISARDGTGNSAEGEPISCDSKIDALGPRVVSMDAGVVKGEQTFLSGRSVVKVILEDDASGVSEKDVKLDLTQINGVSEVKPNTCVPEGDQVQCSWIVIATRSGIATISVSSSTTDRLGNPLREPFSKSVVIDSSPPTIEKVKVQIFDAKDGKEKNERIAVRDDTVTITALGRGGTTAEGNFSALGVTNTVVPDCVKTSTQIECTFTATVEATGDSGDLVTISFFDEVGNEAVHEEDIPVFGILDTERPNNWRVEKVICTPDSVDSDVTEFINYRVTCGAILKPLTNRARILHVDLDREECTDNGAIADVTLSNSASGTKTPILNVILQTQKYTESLNFTCPLRLTTQVGKSVTAFPEIEEVNIQLGFFVNPLGEAGSQLDRKVLKAIKDADSGWEIVGKLKKVMDYLEKVCKIKSTLSTVLTTLDTVGNVIWGLGSIITKTGILYGVGQGLINAGNGLVGVSTAIDNAVFQNPLFEIIDSMCVILSCSAAQTSDDKVSLSTIGGAGIGGYCTKLQSYLNELIPRIGKGGSVDYDSGVVSGETRSVAGPGSAEDIAQRGGAAPAAQTGLRQAPRNPPRTGFKLDSLSQQPLNVKESIIWSLACLCLPGIIHNLEKWHQVQCKYAVCLGKEVREKGLPVAFCDEQKSYDECAFFFNQIFNAIPFSEVLSDFGALIETLLSDPLALVSTVAGLLCEAFCATPVENMNIPCLGCKLYQDLAKTADAIISIKTFAESLSDFFEVDDGFCGQMNDIKKEIKADQAAANAPPPGEEDEGLIDLADNANPPQDTEEFEEVVEADTRQTEAASRGTT